MRCAWIDAVVRRLVVQKTLPARQIVRFAPWMIERDHPDLPAVHSAIRLVITGRRDPSRMGALTPKRSRAIDRGSNR